MVCETNIGDHPSGLVHEVICLLHPIMAAAIFCHFIIHFVRMQAQGNGSSEPGNTAAPTLNGKSAVWHHLNVRRPHCGYQGDGSFCFPDASPESVPPARRLESICIASLAAQQQHPQPRRETWTSARQYKHTYEFSSPYSRCTVHSGE